MSKSKNTQSEPAKKLIDFLKNAEFDKPYIFIAPVNIKDAEKFVHKMRVQLSRYRNRVREKGRIPRHFKVLFKDAVNIDHTHCNITLIKSLSSHDVSHDIKEVFDELDGGDVING